MTLVEESPSRPMEGLEVGRPTSTGKSDSRADLDEGIAADVDFSSIDEHVRHDCYDDVMDTVRTPRNGDQQMSLDWLEPLELFNLGEVSKPVASQSAAGPVASPGPATMNALEPSAAPRRELHLTDTETGIGLQESSFRGYRSKYKRKRLHVGCGHGDDDDVTGEEAEVLREAKDGLQRRRKARKRRGNTDCRSPHPGRPVITACSPTTMLVLFQLTRRRHCRDDDARSRLSKSCVASTSPEPLELQEQPTWAVDRIVKCSRKNGNVFYRVKWKDT
ncbi:hypothetical protein M409DRAFT_61205 [Zasmidium cellare ATCC 36951]|uniref:Chromo domain-containing protein n=1 Tax=Zasmidium cellare ATCC 36951 TaxID=1080233 RepID=A0A6A6BWH2_ZASCE|nr:uncharacterized protein M409DRAFT_61205 [Zasmidium cellare ATCC 36951]KAF2158933.1 hypothetical protein M409DRAFT_61205 [Zasmidium cellare ATCC 36951]